MSPAVHSAPHLRVPLLAALWLCVACEGTAPVDDCAVSGADAVRGPCLDWFEERDGALDDYRFIGGNGAIGVADVDSDGWLDIVATPPLTVFRNRGDFSFQRVEVGIESPEAQALALADLDNDGDADLVVSEISRVRFFSNDGAGSFMETQPALPTDPVAAHHILPGDFDADGRIDLFFSFPPRPARGRPPLPNLLLMQTGDGAFVQAEADFFAERPVFSWAAALLDLDDDGDSDLYVANDGGRMDFGFMTRDTPGMQHMRNFLLQNDGRGRFVDVADAMGVAGPFSSMGAAVADFDRDGHFDIFTPDFGRNKLHVQTAAGFSERSELLGMADSHRQSEACDAGSEDPACLLVSWGSVWRDFDQDGQAELFVLNRSMDYDGSPSPPQLYQREGDVFQERSLGLGDLAGDAVVPADLDQDGDLDLLISLYRKGLLVLENVGSRGAFLALKLRGTHNTRDGVGASVEVELSDGSTRRAIVGSQGVSHASLPSELHFGLGEHQVEHVSVRWPNGARSEHPVLGANAVLTITEEP